MKAPKWYMDDTDRLWQSISADNDLKTKLRSPTGRHGQVWQICQDALIRIEFLEAKIRELEEERSDHD